MKFKVLIIVYYWPPYSSSGVQRWLKFVKYLDQLGVQTFVVTPKNATAPFFDPKLEVEIPKSTTVVKTKNLELFTLYNLLNFRKPSATIQQGMQGIKGSKSLIKKISLWIRANFFVPDGRVLWHYFATKAAIRLIDEHKIDLVVTSGPPHSIHLAGLKIIKKRNINWVADLRDPWANIYYNDDLPRMSIIKKIDQRLENKVAKSAKALLVTANGLANYFESKNRNVKVIHNGYDAADFENLILPNTSKNFELCFVGTFFPYLDSPGLWRAIEQLLTEMPDFKQFFRIRFTGSVDPSIQQKISNAFPSNSIFDGYMRHNDALQSMANANVLLFSVYNHKSATQVVQGKFYEYLAIKAPILMIGPPESEAALMLYQLRAEPNFDYNDTSGIKNYLVLNFEKWLQNQKSIFRHPDNTQNSFERLELTKKLLNFFYSLSE